MSDPNCIRLSPSYKGIVPKTVFDRLCAIKGERRTRDQLRFVCRPWACAHHGPRPSFLLRIAQLRQRGHADIAREVFRSAECRRVLRGERPILP